MTIRTSLKPALGLLIISLSWTLLSCTSQPSLPDIEPPTNIWTTLNPYPFSDDLNAVWGASFNDAYAVGDCGTIVHFNGLNWKHVKSLTTEHLNDIHGTSADNIYAVGNWGTVLHFDGSYWHRISYPGNEMLRQVWCRTADDVYLVTDVGTILHLVDSEWIEVDTGLPEAIFLDLWGSPDGQVFAVGSAGTAVRFDGSQWLDISFEQDFSLIRVWGISASAVYVVQQTDDDDHIYRYDGNLWNPVSTADFENAVYIGHDPDGLPLVYGWYHDSGFLYSPDRHNSNYWFRVLELPDNRVLRDLVLMPDGPAIGVGDCGTLITMADQAGSLNSFGKTVDLRAGWGLDCGHFLAIANEEQLLYYSDIALFSEKRVAGQRFSDIWATSRDNVFVVGAAGFIMNNNGSHYFEMVTNTTADLDGVWGSNPDDVFAVGQGGVILHYDGTAWLHMIRDTDRDLSQVQGRAADDVYVTSHDGQILHYDGQSWRVIYRNPTDVFHTLWVSQDTDDVWFGGATTSGVPGLLVHYDGSEFTRIDDGFDRITAIWGLAADNIYLATSGPTWHFDGLEWSRETDLPATGTGYYDLWGSPECGIFIFGANGEIRHKPNY